MAIRLFLTVNTTEVKYRQSEHRKKNSDDEYCEASHVYTDIDDLNPF